MPTANRLILVLKPAFLSYPRVMVLNLFLGIDVYGGLGLLGIGWWRGYCLYILSF